MKEKIGRPNEYITECNTTLLKCFVTNPFINFPEVLQITRHCCVRTCHHLTRFAVYSNHISLTPYRSSFMAKLLVRCCFMIENLYSSSSPPFTFGLLICPLFKCQHFLVTFPAFCLTVFGFLTSPVSLFSAQCDTKCHAYRHQSTKLWFCLWVRTNISN